MIAQMFTVGEFFTNCYVISCQQKKEAIIVDPGFDDRLEAEKIFKFIDENALALKFVLNTHGHPDHTCGNILVKEKFPVPILIHEYDAHMLGGLAEKASEFLGFKNSSPPADMSLRDGALVKFGMMTLRVIHTPGHSCGSISPQGDFHR